MKTLPPSWTKTPKDKQLSFADTLFNKPTDEDVFVEHFLEALKNAKFLRYRIAIAPIKRGERIACDMHWSEVLEVGATILSNVAKKSTKYRMRTIQDFLHDVFINKIDYPPVEGTSRGELLHHHDNVSAKIRGMFLAYPKALRGRKREMKIILDNITASNIKIHRLEEHVI